MSLKPNYLSHESQYRQLQSCGFEGWGGETFETRMQNWASAIESLVKNPNFPAPPAKVLEIGSGAGDVALQFDQLGYEVSGIEISPTGVEWSKEKARQLGRSVRFQQGSVCEMKMFSDSEFDVVIDGNCLHCIIGEDRQKCLSEVHRVLGPGGLFFVSSMVGDLKQDKAHFKFDPQIRCQIQNNLPYRYMGHPKDVLQEISDAGFEISSQHISNNEWWDHLTCLARKI